MNILKFKTTKSFIESVKLFVFMKEDDNRKIVAYPMLEHVYWVAIEMKFLDNE